MRALQFTLFGLLLTSWTAYAQWQLNLPPGITPSSHDIYNLHMTVIWVCVAIGVIVFGVLSYSIIFHRKSLGVRPHRFHEHFWLEITWTLIPFFILVVLAIPGTKVLLNLNDTSKPDLNIKVTGYQWRWRYEYMENGVTFFSNLSTPLNERMGKNPKNSHYLEEVDNPLVIPTHKKVRLLITSNDVIHSWWVPEFGVKKQGVPGFINELWVRVNRAGTYRGQCAQFCGLNHGFMPVVVVAKDERDFNAWLNQKTMATKPVASGSTTVGVTPSATITPSGSPASPTSIRAGTATSLPSTTSSATPVSATSVSATSVSATPTSATSIPVPPKPATTPATKPVATVTTAAPISKTMDELMKHGEQIYQTLCSACHQPSGEGLPPLYPALKNSPIVKGLVRNHIEMVLNGKPGTAMQAFKEQLTDEDIAAVVTYERNSWGNNTKDIVQPDQISKIKLGTPP